MNGVIFTESANKKQIRVPSDPQDACLNHFLISSKVFQHPFNTQVPLDPIKQICCNQDTVLALTNEGLIYGWGKNSSSLISPDPVPVVSPILIPNLKKITQVSLSKTHAAAIDEKGLLYTWGCPLYGKLGYSSTSTVVKPELVSSSQPYKSIQVSCGLKFTSIRTDGCYVHIYGELGQCHASRKKTEIKSPKSLSFYSHPEIDKYSILDLSAGQGFLSVLADSGQVFVLDQCLEAVRLPVKSESRVLRILAGEKSLWGVAADSMYFWKADGRVRNYCELASWQASVFETADIKIFNWGSAYLILIDELEEPVYQLRPCKRTEYAKRLFFSTFESTSSSLAKEDKAPVLSFDDLERLFPNGDSQNTIEKIMKLRIDHYRYAKILKAFSPKVHPVAGHAFNRVKEYAWTSYLYKRTVKVSNMVGVLSSFVKQSQSMAKLKFFWRLKEFKKVFLLISKKENVGKIEKGCEVICKKWGSCVREVFTVIKIKKTIKTTETLKRWLRKLSCKNVEIAFSKIKEEVFLFKLCEKAFGIFRRFIVRKALLFLQQAARKAEKSVMKIRNIYKVLKDLKESNLKLAFRSIKRAKILIKSNENYFIEFFLMLLTRIVSTKLISSYSKSFNSLKKYTKKSIITHRMTLFLNNLSLRLKNSTFKQLTQAKNPFPPLFYLLKSRFTKVLSQVFTTAQQVRINQIAFLAATVQKVLSNCLFKTKLQIFYSLKHRRLSRTHSENNEDPFLDSSLELKQSGEDAFLTTASDHKYFHKANSASSPNAFRKSHCCFRRSLRVPKPKKSYKYYKGEKVTWEKYLGLNKPERKSLLIKDKTSPLATPKAKNAGSYKPPWKPARSNTVYQKEYSAIKKGFEYNEEIRRKLMKQRSSNEMDESKNTAFTNDKRLLKLSRRPLTDSISNLVSLPSCNDNLSITLAGISIERGIKLVQKRLKKQSFEMLKISKKTNWKLKIPTPSDSLKLVQHLDTIKMIKSDWQFGMIVVAVDNFRLCVRKIVARSLFEALINR